MSFSLIMLPAVNQLIMSCMRLEEDFGKSAVIEQFF